MTKMNLTAIGFSAGMTPRQLFRSMWAAAYPVALSPADLFTEVAVNSGVGAILSRSYALLDTGQPCRWMKRQTDGHAGQIFRLVQDSDR